jgi:hypothetical protein
LAVIWTNGHKKHPTSSIASTLTVDVILYIVQTYNSNLEVAAKMQKVDAEKWTIQKLSLRQRSNKDWQP